MQQSQRYNAATIQGFETYNCASKLVFDGHCATERKFVPETGAMANVEGGIWQGDAVYSTPSPFPRHLARQQELRNGAGGTRNWDTDGVRIYG